MQDAWIYLQEKSSVQVYFHKIPVIPLPYSQIVLVAVGDRMKTPEVWISAAISISKIMLGTFCLL